MAVKINPSILENTLFVATLFYFNRHGNEAEAAESESEEEKEKMDVSDDEEDEEELSDEEIERRRKMLRQRVLNQKQEQVCNYFFESNFEFDQNLIQLHYIRMKY